jgi:hypothetical protein
MTLNLKVILSAVGVAALLASPALAKTRHAPATAPVQTETRAPAPHAAVTPYAADVSGRTVNGLNPDFQISGDK